MKERPTAPLILASASPRRIEMMKKNGYDPQIFPAKIEEELPFAMEVQTAVMYLACKKALWVEAALPPEQKATAPLIVSADTVVYQNRLIGKPKDRQEAFAILSALRSSCHQVITGVCLLQAGAPVRRLFYETTDVYFKDYSDAELSAYVDTDEPYDKAGGYAIQETFGQYIKRIDGDRDNVIGFPWTRFLQELAQLKDKLAAGNE